jgi:hypothetical protein
VHEGVGKHRATRITDVLLSAARGCSNCGIENVHSFCASDTTMKRARSAALGSQICCDNAVFVPFPRANRVPRRAYEQCLRNTRVQGPLFVYLLPFCLQALRDDLRGFHEGYGGLIEHLYPFLADQRVFDQCLNDDQREAASEFIRQAILDEIDDQPGLSHAGSRSRPYRWVRALTTYGVLRPDAQRLWNAWWSLGTVGRSVAAVQYISCLMYSERENPVFAPWTPDAGGGPPCLWDFEGHLYAHRWLKPNVDFLKENLSAQSVRDLLVRAVNGLAGHAEFDTAAAIQEDFPLCTETVETRCAELSQFLETVQKSTSDFSWSA